MGSRPKAGLVKRAKSKSVKITKGSGSNKRYKTNAELQSRVGGKKRKGSGRKRGSRRKGSKRR